MSDSVTMTYGGYSFDPVPTMVIARTPIRRGDTSLISQQYTATLNGFVTTGGTPASGLLTLDEKMEELTQALSCDCLDFHVACNGTTVLRANPRIGEISFGESNDNWTRSVPFTIQLEYENESDPNGMGVCDSGNFLRSVSENWQLTFTEDQAFYDINLSGFGQDANSPIIKLTHTVSAQGVTNCSGQKNGWEYARDWVLPRLGYDSNFGEGSGSHNFQSLSSLSAYNHVRVNNASETDGSYEVTENWLLVDDGQGGFPGAAQEEWTVNVEESLQNPFIEVTINGTIQGLEQVSYSGDQFSYTQTKYESASGYWNDISGRLYYRANALSNQSNLNLVPRTQTVGHNPAGGIITYNYQYDTRPSDCLTGVGYNIRNENITINDSYPTDVFASITVLGRSCGPVLQDINTKTAGTRQLQVDLVLDAQDGCIVGSGSVNSLLIPPCKPAVDQLVEYVLQDLSGSYDSIFKTTDQENWVYKQGNYSRTVQWTYGECCQMAIQKCLPKDCYGPLHQHVFLGASVVSFNATVGWDEQNTEFNIQLVEDTTCSTGNLKVYYDSNLNVSSGYFADPGFLGKDQDITGRPVYFAFHTDTSRAPDFEFAGIIQSWTENNSDQGNVIDVRISSPHDILRGCQAIINDYEGATSIIPNVFNIYGYYEDGGCSSFGNSEQTQKGIPWRKVKEGLSLLTSAIPTTATVLNYSYGGRIQFKAGTNWGYGIIPEDFTGYFLDLSEIPDGPDYYKILGTNLDVLSIISQVTSDFGFSYYLELVPVNISSSVAKILKVRTANRSTQPALGAIANFVNYSDVSGCGTISKSSGVELRSELTNTLVLGGRKKQMYWVENNQNDDEFEDDLIQPFWGLDPSGNAIMTSVRSGNWAFSGNFAPLNYELQTVFLPPSILVYENEILSAKEGFDSWLSHVSTWKTPMYNVLLDNNIDTAGLYDLNHLIGIINDAARAGELRGADLLALNDKQNLTDQQFNDLETIYKYINVLAEEYYGRKFMIRLPQLCAKFDNTTNEITFNREVTDGGWNEINDVEYTNLIGINTTSRVADFFRTNEGTFRPFVRYNNVTGLDYSQLSEDQYFAISGSLTDGSGDPVFGALWVKAQTQPEFVFGNAIILNDPRVVVEVPQPVTLRRTENDIEADFATNVRLLNLIVDLNGGDVEPEEALKDIKDIVGSSTLAIPSYQLVTMPDAVTVPMQNNEEIYGPWYAGTLGVVGNTEVRQDSTLVPWNFGGMTLLSTAGQDIANQGVTNMQLAERGSIRVVGLPTLQLGAELLTYNGDGYAAGQRSYWSRVSSSTTVGTVTYYYTQILNAGYWAGNFGPNITDISVSVDSQGGITTNYNVRTFTPVFGRFSKYNADRLKELQEIRQKIFLTLLNR